MILYTKIYDELYFWSLTKWKSSLQFVSSKNVSLSILCCISPSIWNHISILKVTKIKNHMLINVEKLNKKYIIQNNISG